MPCASAGEALRRPFVRRRQKRVRFTTQRRPAPVQHSPRTATQRCTGKMGLKSMTCSRPPSALQRRLERLAELSMQRQLVDRLQPTQFTPLTIPLTRRTFHSARRHRLGRTRPAAAAVRRRSTAGGGAAGYAARRRHSDSSGSPCDDEPHGASSPPCQRAPAGSARNAEPASSLVWRLAVPCTPISYVLEEFTVGEECGQQVTNLGSLAAAAGPGRVACAHRVAAAGVGGVRARQARDAGLLMWLDVPLSPADTTLTRCNTILSQ